MMNEEEEEEEQECVLFIILNTRELINNALKKWLGSVNE